MMIYFVVLCSVTAWTGHVTMVGLLLLMMAILLVLSLFYSFTAYLIILVYVSGVLVLLLYLTILSFNLKIKNMLTWVLVWLSVFYVLMYDTQNEGFSFYVLAFSKFVLSMFYCLMIVVLIMLAVSFILSKNKTIRLI